MQLLFFSQANLQDRLFLRDVFKQFPQLKPPFIIVHEAYQDHVDTVRMLTKRVSAHLSEGMVPNLAFSGDQRNLLSVDGDKKILINTKLLGQMLANVSGVVINTLVREGAVVRLSSSEPVLKAFRQQMDLERIIFFPDNPASPLGGNKTALSSEEDYIQAMNAFEEESNIIEKAFGVKPSVIASAHNFYR